MVILTKLILLIHEHVLPLFSVIFNFVLRYLKFSLQRSFASLARFIPWYFIFFETVVNRIISLNFLLCLLLVYREIDLCKLILYPATMLNLFVVSSRSFLVEFLASVMYNILSPNGNIFTSCFPICISLISFSC